MCVWLPIVHFLCTLWNFPFYNTWFLLIKKKKNLTTLSLQKFIKEEVPNSNEQVPEKDRFLVIEAWKHSDFLCRNYILSGLDDILYNVYSNINTSKELWEALEKKYKAEDAGLNLWQPNFLIIKWLIPRLL